MRILLIAALFMQQYTIPSHTGAAGGGGGAAACSNSAPSGTTIKCVQSAWGYQNFSTTTVLAGSVSTGSGAPTFSTNPTAGDYMAVFAAANLTLTSITDNCNTGGTSDTYTIQTGTNTTVGYAKIGVTGACSVTFTTTASSGHSVLMVEELNGVNASTPVDPASLSTPNVQLGIGTGTTITSASITTVQNGDYIFGATFDASSNSTVYTAGSGFALDRYQGSIGNTSQTEIRGQSSAGAIAATFAHSVFSSYETGIIAFRT